MAKKLDDLKVNTQGSIKKMQTDVNISIIKILLILKDIKDASFVQTGSNSASEAY